MPIWSTNLEQTPENQEWKAALNELGVSYRQRRISGALVALCFFHDEKTPSMYMWPSGNLYCHGCGAEERVEGFTEKAKMWREKAEAWHLEDVTFDKEMFHKDGPEGLMPPF